MDYLSRVILAALEERFVNDKAYLSEKKEELEENKNKHDGMLYLYKLDKKSLEAVAKRLDLEYEDLVFLKEILKKI